MLSEKDIRTIVGREFDNIAFTREPAGLYDPLRYMIEIGGKRLRPTLCLTAYSLWSDKVDEGILSPMAALEVFHSFTLLHDDIMDRSPLRRGAPTVWTKWGEDTAILSGDVMLIDAYRRIAKAPADKLGSVLDLFSRTAAQVCDGQQYDMEFESVDEVPMQDYNKMIGLKTAVLIACSAKMGAMLAGASASDCDALYNYGYELGMAFQVADDYLDAYGDQTVFGKPIGGDIVNSKKSWLTVRTLEKTGDREGFLKAFSLPADDAAQKREKIERVMAYYDDCGVAEDARQEILRFSHRALAAVQGADISAEGAELLRRFDEHLIGRVK